MARKEGLDPGGGELEPEELEEARALFYQALECQKRGRFAQAEDAYRRALSLASGKASILTNLSAVLIQQKKFEEALPYIEQALRHDAQDEVALLNKALYLYNTRRLQEALACCDQALAIRPDFAQAHSARGIVLAECKRFDEALASFDAALAISPDLAEALCKRAFVLKQMLRHEEALASLNQSLAIEPGYCEALQSRGHVLHALGRDEEAVASYRAALEHGGDAEELRYFLAALGAEAPPPATPRRLVVGLFDSYAEGFDRHQGLMEYDVPRSLFAAVSAAAPAEGWDIADLGCGTGLCGPLFRPVARTLTGVDLALNMIRRTRERGVYDDLVEGEITEFLNQRAAAFDLVIAADVFIYIGDMAPVLGAARSALRRGGRFAFSLETHDGAGFVLRPSRRYAHSLSYLRQCAADHGFTESSITPVVVRKEYGRNVDGVIAVLRSRGD